MRISATASLALLAVACSPVVTDSLQEPTTTSLPPPSSTQPSTTSTSTDHLDTGEPAVIVLPGEDGQLPDDTEVSCGGIRFPYSALESITPLSEADPDGQMWNAMEPFMTGPEGSNWPQTGWYVLHDEGETVTLVARTGDGGLADAFLDKTDDGYSWSGAGLGEMCEIEFVVERELNTVVWSLDPTAPAPTPVSTLVSVILEERECTGGMELGDRLIGPQVVMTQTEVRLGFAATPPEGEFFDCQGNPPTPFVVELPEPMEDRTLVEGYGIGVSLDDYLP